MSDKPLNSKVSLIIYSKNRQLLQVISKCLEPENSLLNAHTKIFTDLDKDQLTINIFSDTKISTIRNTLDDILHTTHLISSIYKKI